VWKKKEYTSSVVSKPRKYIPLLYNEIVQNILSKTVDNTTLRKFDVKTSSDLHKYTKAQFINDEKQRSSNINLSIRRVKQYTHQNHISIKKDTKYSYQLPTNIAYLLIIVV